MKNTLETLKSLRSKALATKKTQTLKSLRADFSDLLESDKELAAMELNDWCSIRGNSVEECKKTKGFDMFALHVGKIIEILEPFEMDWDEILGDEEKEIQSQDELEEMKPAKPYFSLLVKNMKTGKWFVEFGDYFYNVVTQEIEDSYSNECTRIIKTNHDQASIEKAVKELNQ